MEDNDKHDANYSKLYDFIRGRGPEVVGFTGTRRGMTPKQKETVWEALRPLDPRLTVGLHGDCIGADADFHEICRELGWAVWCRPCTFANLRAFTDAVQIAEPEAPMPRNRAIARQQHLGFGCPPNDVELKRGSGTWATIRYGVKYGKPVHVVYPDGRMETR